ncbi:MAG: elongation factor 1-beta [Candidatus Nanoarchaeia archaeon]
MADILIKLKVMPAGVDINLENLQKTIEAKIKPNAKLIHSISKEPVAFGLVSLVFTFLADENKINLENLENNIRSLPEIQSVEVIDVRRAVG